MSVPGSGVRDPVAKVPRVTDVDSVLLCAGAGKRLRPLTDSIPKALVPVAGRPIVDYHLEAWRAAGVHRVVLVTGYREDQVREHVGNGARYGLRVAYVTQSEPRGSGDALLVAAGHLRAEYILVGYCDVFFGRNPAIWAELLSDRRSKIVGVRIENAGAYGRLEEGADGAWPRLVAIHEKDGRSTPGLINGGAYLLPRRIFDILPSVPLSSRGEIELTDAVTALVAGGGEVRIVPVRDWVDVGTPENLALAGRLAGLVRG